MHGVIAWATSHNAVAFWAYNSFFLRLLIAWRLRMTLFARISFWTADSQGLWLSKVEAALDSTSAAVSKLNHGSVSLSTERSAAALWSETVASKNYSTHGLGAHHEVWEGSARLFQEGGTSLPTNHLGVIYWHFWIIGNDTRIEPVRAAWASLTVGIRRVEEMG